MTLAPPPKNKAAPGEPMVWFTALGLALGLLMVAGLLGVITVNGLEVFWPDRVARIELHPDRNSPVGKTFFATTVRERKKSSGTGEESLFFAGNKNLLGLAYFYCDADAVARQEFPVDLMRVERAEFGNALLTPRTLVTREGENIAATDPLFFARLDALIKESDSLRDQLSSVEQGAIGDINARLQTLRIGLLKAADQIRLSSDAATKKRWEEKQGTLETQRAQLQADYENLATAAGEIRQQLARGELIGTIGDNREMRIAGGDILHYSMPNTLGFFGRLQLFGTNIWRFLSEDPREANTEGGVFPAIFGTFCMTVLMSALVTPFGVIAAIYLREYAKQGAFVRWVRICVNNLAGVPSIVFGVFGVGFFVYIAGGAADSLLFADEVKYTNAPVFGTGGVLWASLTLALMTLPVVIVATEEALSAVPRGAREASLACGASKWQTIRNIVVPAAAPGILTGMILAMARGAGEVAPLMMVGVVKLAPTLPFDGTFPFVHLDRKFMHLGFHIYDLGFQSPDADAARPMVFATTLLLILLVLVLNAGAIAIRNHLRRKYQSGAF